MDFFDALVRYEVTLWNAIDADLANRDRIDLGRLHALRVVRRHGGRARVQELSDEIGITVGAASKLADRLERDGLVERRPNPANRRSSLISLTPAGRAALTAALRTCRVALARALGDVDLTEIAAVLVSLQTRLDAVVIGDVA